MFAKYFEFHQVKSNQILLKKSSHENRCQFSNIKKSGIQETLNLSTNADSITIAMKFFQIFFYYYFLMLRALNKCFLGGSKKN